MGKGNNTILDGDLVERLSADKLQKKSYDINSDKVFLKYANKSLPLSNKKSRAGLAPYTGAFSLKHKKHILRRLTFGSKLDDLRALDGLTADQAVDAMVTKAVTPPAPPVNHYENFYQDSSLVPYGQTWVDATRYVGSTRAWRIYSMKAWWTENMMTQDMTIEEKMLLFFHSNYPIEMYNATGRPNFQYRYLELLRTHCLGNLKDFVKGLTLDGAMLWYLNGRVNTKNAPDENYARELQELFSVGKEGNTFLESDVVAAAKVLTGWRTREKTAANPTTPWEVYFLAGQHDTTTKTFSSYYNNTTISPDNSNPAGFGANEIDDLINMIFTHGAQEIAKLFAKRIYRFFVYYDIDATTESVVINGLAQTLIANNWEIKPMLKQLFKSEHFFDVANMDCAIKSPLDYFIGLFRNLNFEVPSTASIEERYTFYHRLNQTYIKLNGMNIGDPPNVSGWPANYQVPFFDQIWINSDTMPKRLIYTDYFTRSAGIYIKSGVYFKMDLIGFVEDLDYAPANSAAGIMYVVNYPDPTLTSAGPPSVGEPDWLVRAFASMFLGLELTPASLDYYKGILLSGQTSNYYWTSAWNNYKSNPSNNTYKNIIETRLRNLLKEMLHLPEHHLA